VRRALAAVVVAACAIGAAACGDGNSDKPDAAPNPIDAPVDAPVTPVNLTSYVTDLVKNQTMDTTAPKAFGEFSTLPDPDGDANNTSAYDSLFM
jgi:ABC-type phosphate/phosphonate transport system substrate-binding protein